MDIIGNVLAAAVHSAGISKSRGAYLVLIRLFVALPHLLKILVDGGYKQGVIDWGKSMIGGARSAPLIVKLRGGRDSDRPSRPRC